MEETNGAPTKIDEMLNETEIGSWISRHKNLAIFLVIFSLLGVIGYGIFSSVQGKKHNAYNDKLYLFRTDVLEPYKEKKIKEEELLKKYAVVSRQTAGYDGLTALSLLVSDELLKAGKKREALKILEDQKGSHSYMKYLLSLRKAVLFEDLKQTDAAIKELESITNSSVKVLEEKVYLDLGRLYLTTGNKEKAKSNLQYVIDNSKENEFIKLARLFMEKL